MLQFINRISLFFSLFFSSNKLFKEESRITAKVVLPTWIKKPKQAAGVQLHGGERIKESN